MDDGIICIVKMVRRKLEVAFDSEPEGFSCLVGSGIRFQFRTMDSQGMPHNWLFLDLYDDAKKGQHKLEPGILGFFEAEKGKKDADKKRISICLEPHWATLREAPLDQIKAAMQTAGQELPGNYYIDIDYKLDSLPEPGEQHIQIQGRKTCMIKPAAVAGEYADVEKQPGEQDGRKA